MVFDYIFFGDSFTYGQDAESSRSTWPYHYLTIIDKADANYAIQAMPGQSNSGIFLDVLDCVKSGKIDATTTVFVGLTNMYRDATSLCRNGIYQFDQYSYKSANVHANDPRDALLNEYSELFCQEQDWMFAAQSFQALNAIQQLLTTVGCEFYQIDVILGIKHVQKLLNLPDFLIDSIIEFSSVSPVTACPDLYNFILTACPDIELSKSKHFTSTGYKRMAELIHKQIEGKTR